MKRVLLVIALVGLIAMPSMAEGWFVDFGTWYAKPANSQTFGEFVDSEDPDMEYHRPVNFDMDNDFTWELGFGYDTGDFGKFSVSYWGGYDDTYSFFTDDSTYDGNSDTWFTPGGDKFDDMTYIFTTRAWSVDVKWSNTFGGEGKWSGEYFTGLRYFDYELSASNDMSDDPDDYVIKTWDSDVYGLGFCGGMSGVFAINDMFAVHGGLDLAFLRGTRDVDTMFRDESGDGFHKNFAYNDEIFTQFGADLGLMINFTDNFNMDFGYKFASWIDAATDNQFKPDRIDYDMTEDVNWDGFFLNFGWDFGK